MEERIGGRREKMEGGKMDEWMKEGRKEGRKP